MWKSNALKLRKCSSPAAFRHGLCIRWYSLGKSLPITENEFRDALENILPWHSIANSKAPLGFAISGGVDSMALATLYARARSERQDLPQAHGFIVDHKARPGSTEEARWVEELLRSKFGMEASILTLTWPEDSGMHNMLRFETEARTRRYQALGRACRDLIIRGLMIAHHADDQAETAMMRLANNRHRSGLQGMQSAEWIPECEGIYGVYHSGGSRKPDSSLDIPFPVETGGIQTIRPLLTFEKARLVATCEDMGVRWAEDKSNQIPTITSRNAIRHIYKNHELPAALSMKSLVDLTLSMTKRIEAHKSYAEKLFDECLMKLDIQTGSLRVRFPPFSALLSRPIKTAADKNEAWNNAYCLLKRIASLVTPRLNSKSTASGRLAARIESIYPDFTTEDRNGAEIDASKTSFTVHGLWWRQFDRQSPSFHNTLASDNFGASRRHSPEWLLTRQSLLRGEAEKSAMQMVVPPSQILSTDADSTERSKENYQLLDGRYWIKIKNHTDDTLNVRLFQKQDIRHLPRPQILKTSARHNTRNPIPEHYIPSALSLVKPFEVCYTLPAVFRTDSSTGEESLIGFPTLDVHTAGFGSPKNICDWSVHYKKIDLGRRSARDIIIPGVKSTDIMAEEEKFRVGAQGHARFRAKTRRLVEDHETPFASFKRVGIKKSETSKKMDYFKWTHTAPSKYRQGEDSDVLGFLENDKMQKSDSKRGSRRLQNRYLNTCCKAEYEYD